MVTRDEQVQAVMEVISKHDPAGLLRMGAPADEYFHEAQQIVDQWGRRAIKVGIVYSVFRGAFSPLRIPDYIQCFRLAEEIQEVMQ